MKLFLIMAFDAQRGWKKLGITGTLPADSEEREKGSGVFEIEDASQIAIELKFAPKPEGFEFNPLIDPIVLKEPEFKDDLDEDEDEDDFEDED
jgi:hypothetical protein